jgi:hypothetical protein
VNSKAAALSAAVDTRTVLPAEREIAALKLPLPPHSHHGVNVSRRRQGRIAAVPGA